MVEVIARSAFPRIRRDQILRQEKEWDEPGDCEAVIAEFIRTKGITRCPTACVLPTQGSIDAADRVALEKHAVAQERVRQDKSSRARPAFLVCPASCESGEIGDSARGIPEKSEDHLGIRATSGEMSSGR